MAEKELNIREMRQRITLNARRGDRVDGKPPKYSRPMSMTSALVSHILRSAEYEGFSGEDAMTVLAYHALVQLEEAMDRELDRASIEIPNLLIPKDPAS